MPGSSELHSLFKGLFDESSSSSTGHEIATIMTPNKQSNYKVGSIWATQSIRVLSKHKDLSTKGADRVTKRDYQALPPDAIDAAGKPRKKVKIIDLESYQAVESGGNHKKSLTGTTAPQPSVTKKGGMQPFDSDASMDVDRTGNAQQGDGRLMNTNARTAIGKDIVQPNGTDQSCPVARAIGGDQKPPPGSQINQVFLSPQHDSRENLNEGMDTIDDDGLELENDDSNHINPHKTGKAVMLKPSADSGIVIEPEKTTRENQGIMDMIEEAVQIDNNNSVEPNAQNAGGKTIPKPSVKPTLRSQSELDVNSDYEDEFEYNQQDNIRRPKYSSSVPVRKGYVSWWSNVLGKGQISERHTNEVRTIHWWQLKPQYGALHSGVSVEYQWEHGNFQNLWVVQGMPYVL